MLSITGRHTVFGPSSISDATVESGGELYLGNTSYYNPEYASSYNAVIKSGGYMSAYYGKDFNTYIRAGGSADIGDNYPAPISITSNAKVFGVLRIYDYGSAANTIIGNTGVMEVNGVVTDTKVSAGGKLEVLLSSYYYDYYPGSSLYTTVEAGGKMNVAGYASNTILRGEMEVTGSAMNISMYGGASVKLSGGGSGGGKINDLNMSGGTLNVGSGGIATNVSAYSGAQLQVLESGIISAASLNKGASMFVSSGADAHNTTLNAGAVLNVYRGGYVSATKVGGSQTIFSDGLDIDTTILARGSQVISSGGSSYYVTIDSGGTLTVANGGYASHIIVKAGGKQNLLTGGRAVDIELAESTSLVVAGGAVDAVNAGSGASLTVTSNGLSTSSIISGGAMFISGGYGNYDIFTSANQHLRAGAVATGASLHTSATQIVSSGARADATVVNLEATQTVLAGGSASGASINSGLQKVYGHAFATELNSGGSQIVYKGGMASATILNGGSQSLRAGATIMKGTILEGTQTVASGASVSDITLSGGSQILYNGAKATGMKVLNGAQVINAGATAYSSVVSQFTVSSSDGDSGASGQTFTGQQIVAGVAQNTTLTNGGTQVIRGGTAIGTVMNGGSILLEKGAIRNVIVAKGSIGVTSANGVISGTTLRGAGVENVQSGRSVKANISSGGRQIVGGGASALNANVYKGGSQIINGGFAQGTKIASGGVLVLSSGGVAKNISGGAAVKVSMGSGCIISGATLGARASLSIASQGTVRNLIMNGGGTLALNGNLAMTGTTNRLANVKNSIKSANFIQVNSGATLILGASNSLGKARLYMSGATLKVNGAGNTLGELYSPDKCKLITYDLGGVSAKSTAPMLKPAKKTIYYGNYNIVTSARQQMGQYELSANISYYKASGIVVKRGTASAAKLTVNGTAANAAGVRYKLVCTKSGQLNLTLTAISGAMKKGTAKNDKLTGTANCDIFYGGKGNDTITGKGGRDVAVYDKTAWGKDTIKAQTSGGTMTIVFNGLKASQITSKKSGKNMVFTRKGVSGQSITVQGWNDVTHTVVYGGSLGQFSKYVNAAKPTRTQQMAARNEVWKQTGLLA